MILNVKRMERPIELGGISYEQRLDEVFMKQLPCSLKSLLFPTSKGDLS